MGLADDWRRLVNALTGRPDSVEEERLLALFQNRSELKKELTALDDERHRLLDRLKLQEGATMRVEEQLASLEQYLGRPDVAQRSIAYFQLRALWRLAARRIETFAAELARQQKDRERKQQLVAFDRSRRERLGELEQELVPAEVLADQLNAEQRTARQKHAAMRGFWNYFRRRKAADAIAKREARIEAAVVRLNELSERRNAIAAEPPPTFAGVSIEGRRAVNLAIIAAVESLSHRLGAALAPLARESTLIRVYDADYGPDAKVQALIAATTHAIADLDSMQDDLPDIKKRTDRLRQTAAWRSQTDTVPLAESISPPDAGPGAAARGPVNVLLDEYFEIYKVLQE
jgi:hypothetical protein